MYEDLGSAPLGPLPANLQPAIGTEIEAALTAREFNSPVEQEGALLASGSDDLSLGDTELSALSTIAPAGSVDVGDPSYLPPTDDGGGTPGGTGEEGEIVVIGRRPDPDNPDDDDHYYLWWYNQPTDPVQYPDPGTGGDIQNQATPTSNWDDAPEVEVDIANPANADAARAEAEMLLKEIARLTVEIDALADLKMVTLADGTQMRGLEVKKLWATIDFKITDEPPQPGRAGGYNNEERTSTFFLRDGSGGLTLTGWAGSDPNGLSFILLHELVHSSRAGVAEDTAQLEAYRAQRPDNVSLVDHYAMYYDSIEFEENEEFANVGALRIATAMNISPMTGFYPTSGYQYEDPDDDPDPVP